MDQVLREILKHWRMLWMGMVKMEPPTETSMPSMMAMVRGILRVVVMPGARLTGNGDGAADFFHVLFDHVHAHATAGSTP